MRVCVCACVCAGVGVCVRVCVCVDVCVYCQQTHAGSVCLRTRGVCVGVWVCVRVCILSAEPRWQRLPEDQRCVCGCVCACVCAGVGVCLWVGVCVWVWVDGCVRVCVYCQQSHAGSVCLRIRCVWVWVCAGVCILSAEPRWLRLPEEQRYACGWVDVC